MPKNIEPSQTSREVAQLFFDEMAEWERWSSAADRLNDTVNQQRLAKVKEIFKKYLSKQALARHQSRYDFLDFGEPPEFQLEILRIEEDMPDKHWVYVPAGLIGGEGRYYLVLENGEWRIKYKEIDIANKGKWKKWLDL
ncbi:NTF2 fold immunity protein [Collimonas pratensis]|uniref:NTF2 fold immunity protein n=1 Tax=Collimonas pratensis TaxID=279113 RepID=UPI000782F126|nr:NTF2 fold immunity protein [Collimonas pratensis]